MLDGRVQVITAACGDMGDGIRPRRIRKGLR